MEISQVPFAAHNGIEIDEQGVVYLPAVTTLENHLSHVHAGAQFLLAESASGYYLLTAFPEFVGRVIPLLRESKIKYSQQAIGKLVSEVVVSDEAVAKFLKVLKSRRKAVIEVAVNIRDTQDEVTCSGVFRWFVQLTD